LRTDTSERASFGGRDTSEDCRWGKGNRFSSEQIQGFIGGGWRLQGIALES
jgi:hypothetical protein